MSRIFGITLGVWGLAGGLATWLEHKDNEKRDLSVTDGQRSPMLVLFNNSDLRHREIERIKGLSVSTEFSPRGQALFSNEHFAANGSFNINKATLLNGVKQGELSFKVPGLDADFYGSWLSMDPIDTEAETKLAFEQIHGALRDGRKYEEVTLSKVFQDVVELVKTESVAADSNQVR